MNSLRRKTRKTQSAAQRDATRRSNTTQHMRRAHGMLSLLLSSSLLSSFFHFLYFVVAISSFLFRLFFIPSTCPSFSPLFFFFLYEFSLPFVFPTVCHKTTLPLFWIFQLNHYLPPLFPSLFSKTYFNPVTPDHCPLFVHISKWISLTFRPPAIESIVTCMLELLWRHFAFYEEIIYLQVWKASFFSFFLPAFTFLVLFDLPYCHFMLGIDMVILLLWYNCFFYVCKILFLFFLPRTSL